MTMVLYIQERTLAGFKYLALEGRICYEYHRACAEHLHPWWMAPAARLLKYKLPVTVLVSGLETLRAKKCWSCVGVRRSWLQQSGVMYGKGNPSAEL